MSPQQAIAHYLIVVKIGADSKRAVGPSEIAVSGSDFLSN
jgi:hypothetical protein